MRPLNRLFFLPVLLAGLTLTGSAQAQYHLKHRFALGGAGGWDYLVFDPAGPRLFISRGTEVVVVDPAQGRVLGVIPNTPGVHGIALAPDLGKGFTSNGRENSVTVFDLRTLRETGRIKLAGAENPDAILYDAASRRVFTFNGRSRNATAIDAVEETVIGNIPLNGKPEFAVADGRGAVFVNIEDTHELTRIDARRAAVAGTWPLAGCEEPAGLAIDLEHRRLFVGCHNRVMAVVNADDGRIVATLPIGDGVDGTAFDPATGLVLNSNGDGTMTVVHQDTPDKYTVVQNVDTQRGARTLALDARTHDVFLVTAEFEEIAPAAGQTRPRRTVKPDTFTLLVYGN